MDTGTDEGEDERTKANNLGVKLPNPPPGKCAPELQASIV